MKYSKEHARYLKRLRGKRIGITAGRIAVVIVFFGLWEALTALGALDSFITSSPSRMAVKLAELLSEGQLMYHMGVTLAETLLAFLLATALGMLAAIALWWCETARKILEPHLVILNSLPKIALGPVIIIWVGAGISAIIVMALLISLIITIINTLQGFLNTDEGKLRLFKTMKASKRQTLFKLVLPSSLPNIFAVLKVNVGLCWVGTIMGEYLVSKAGLGYLIIYGGTVFDLDIVMTATVVLCVLAALMYYAVVLLEKAIKRKFKFDA